MYKPKKNELALDYKKSNRIKAVRTVFEIIALLGLLAAIIYAFFSIKSYQADTKAPTGNNGFIALSYFGVDRTQKATQIDNDMLAQQLHALKTSGYVTISQQDILDYYNNGKPLPQKALYLVFEDGRKDSALFVQPVLEELNYKATMLTYANKFGARQLKFLQPDDLLEMQKNTFWELGSNGYRFEYINVFDRYGNFLGRLDEDQYTAVSKYIENDYNHYLMDFLVDKDRVSVEDRDEMDARLTWDYDQMRNIYTKELGFVPSAYMIMHAGGMFGDANPLVSAVNEREVKKLFAFNFNTEGESLNNQSGNLYNLTRIQSQPYWYTNHLLMRLQDDTKNPMAFCIGDKQRAAYWDVSNGQAEFINNTIVLTTPPSAEGFMTLKNSKLYDSLMLTTVLKGNVVGEQSIYLRYREDGSAYVKITLKDNRLLISQKINGALNQLLDCDLRALDALSSQSKPEVELEAQKAEAQLTAATTPDAREQEKAQKVLEEKKNQIAPTIVEGAEEYVPQLSIAQTGERSLKITLNGSRLTVLVDGKPAASDLKLASDGGMKGMVCLSAARSELNLTDDVYDGVYKDLVITLLPLEAGLQGEVLYDNRLKNLEVAWAAVKETFDNVVDWFIQAF